MFFRSKSAKLVRADRAGSEGMLSLEGGRQKSKSMADVSKTRSVSRTYQRSHSTPVSNSDKRSANMFRLKSILKYSTVYESMQASCGTSTTSGESADTRSFVDCMNAKMNKGTNHSTSNRNIEFKDIIIREYGRTVGDNPSCSSGPPVSISWEYDPVLKVFSVEEYEMSRPPRRTNFEMVIPRQVRQNMLRREWDVSQVQIAAAVRENIRVKNQRRATVNKIGNGDRVEELLQSTSRKVMRGLFLRKSVSKEAEQLYQRCEEAQKIKNEFFDLSEESFSQNHIGGTLSTISIRRDMEGEEMKELNALEEEEEEEIMKEKPQLREEQEETKEEESWDMTEGAEEENEDGKITADDVEETQESMEKFKPVMLTSGQVAL